jgi:peptidoglycan-N-acetylglucosamine deacetylase
MPDDTKTLYLTFDDGPHEEATPFVLDELQKFNAKATFFCIGKNVEANISTYQRLLDEGHAVGNHTFNHVNGWKVGDDAYLADINVASKLIKTNLFRPPYGRIKRSQLKKIEQQIAGMKVIMWTVLSGDFDTAMTGDDCAETVIKYSDDGAVVVFHDSAKALSKLKVALPKVLEHFASQGYNFRSINV